MRHTYGSSLAPDGTAIAYLVRDRGYPKAVQVQLTDDGLGPERIVELPVDGPVTRVLHSPDARWIACEVSPRGTERLETWLVSTDPDIPGATRLQLSGDAKTVLVEWDRDKLAMDAITADGITEARLVDPDTGDYTVLDRRTDSLLVSAEAGHALMRVGPRGSRELLLVRPDGTWQPLLPPEPGAMTDAGTILRDHGTGADPDEAAAAAGTAAAGTAAPATATAAPAPVTVLLATDHGAQRRRVLRVTVADGRVEATELLGTPDSDVDEFVISEDLSTAAVLWNANGISALELLTLGPEQQVLVRRAVELPGMVASAMTITDDGELLSLTVEGPNLPPTVEILRTSTGKIEPLDPERTRRIAERSQENYIPELVHYVARDGLELSGWLYHGVGKHGDGGTGGRGGPQPTYIHLHGGPELQSRPVNHDILTALVDSGVTVFTPNIRGSSGAGRSFLHADDRYGRFAAMDDVADTARFLADAGIGDPARMVLGGRSYGGFLSLLVAARYPGLFRGIVDACGMTSFDTYYRSTEPWLASAAYPKYGYPFHDAELLREVSPLARADHISDPVLFLHGEWDTNVLERESLQMRDALGARGVATRFLRVPGEGHKFVRPKSRRLIAAELLDFLVSLGVIAEPNLALLDERIADMKAGALGVED